MSTRPLRGEGVEGVGRGIAEIHTCDGEAT